MTDKTGIELILKNLNFRVPEVEASAVVTRDGLMVASVLKDQAEPERLAAMCAALLGLADTAAAELQRGKLKLVLLHGESGVLLLVHIGDGYVLAISANPDIRLGSVLVEAKQTAMKIESKVK